MRMRYIQYAAEAATGVLYRINLCVGVGVRNVAWQMLPRSKCCQRMNSNNELHVFAFNVVVDFANECVLSYIRLWISKKNSMKCSKCEENILLNNTM